MKVTRFLTTICLLALATAHVAADPAAEQLFRDGRGLLKAGKVDEACDKFQQSRDVEVKFGTVLNLAACRERQGKFATAWELFLEAKALATTQKGVRDIAEAARRANKVAGKRAFLTVAIRGEDRVPGLVITRNGTEVASSTWDQALPIDPGTYVIDAKATGYESATITVTVAAKAKVTATVPALLKVAVVEPPPPEPPVLTPSEPKGGGLPLVDVRKDRIVPPPPVPGIQPELRRLAIGVAFGETSDGDLTPGVRAIAQRPLGPGALRGVLTFRYARLTNNRADSGGPSNLYGFGLGADYLYAWKSGFASAAGIGVGLDHDTGHDQGNQFTTKWLGARVSPLVLRLGTPRLELGLHAVLMLYREAKVNESDDPTTAPARLVVTAAIDWFFW